MFCTCSHSACPMSCTLSRSQEEVSSLKRKLEKYKSREWAATSDEVLLEEIKTYKVRDRGMGDNERMPKRAERDLVGIHTQDLPVTSQKLLALGHWSEYCSRVDPSYNNQGHLPNQNT